MLVYLFEDTTLHYTTYALRCIDAPSHSNQQRSVLRHNVTPGLLFWGNKSLSRYVLPLDSQRTLPIQGTIQNNASLGCSGTDHGHASWDRHRAAHNNRVHTKHLVGVKWL